MSHETRDVGTRPILLAGGALIAALLLFGAGCWLLLRHYERREAAKSSPASPLAAHDPTRPPGPRLQADPRGDLVALRAEEDALLSGYGWVDRDAGRVHIPIERAMELVAERAEARRR